MSSNNDNLSEPPKSPPIPIRSVYNSFFPEPRPYIRMDMKHKFTETYIDLKKEFEVYKDDLYIFTELKVGEKLGKEKITNEKITKEKITNEKITSENKYNEEDSDNLEILEKKYYKQEPYSGMWITRWWYSEGREKTVAYLDEDFTKFMKYLDKILSNIDCDPTGLYVRLVNEIRDFINLIIQGLYNLKKTYPEFVKMVAKVDSIILTLLDFKEKTDSYLERKKQNVRLTVKSKNIPIYSQNDVPAEYNGMPSNSI